MKGARFSLSYIHTQFAMNVHLATAAHDVTHRNASGTLHFVIDGGRSTRVARRGAQFTYIEKADVAHAVTHRVAERVDVEPSQARDMHPGRTPTIPKTENPVPKNAKIAQRARGGRRVSTKKDQGRGAEPCVEQVESWLAGPANGEK